MTDAKVREAVAAARGAGVTWEQIGETLGMTSLTAQQRYGAPNEAGKVVAP